MALTLQQQTREVYHRHLTLQQRVQSVNIYLLAKIWYVAQFLSPPQDVIKRINTTIMYFIWKGKIFKVPLSTLQRPKCKGRMDLINPMAKCRAMCLYRMMEHIRQQESTTMELLRQCKMELPSINPPQRHTALNKQTYLQQVYIDSAYIIPRTPQESAPAFRRRLYKTIYTTINDTTLTIPMRVNRHGNKVIGRKYGKIYGWHRFRKKRNVIGMK